MSLQAVEEIDDAIQRTKDIVLPFDFMTWTRLAVISIFLGGIGFFNIFTNMPTGFQNTSQYGGSGAMTGMATAAPAVSNAVLLAVAGIFALGFLVFMYLGSVFRFVMFRSLREKEVKVRKNIGRHYVDGFKYFLFQIGMFMLMAAVFIGWIASFAASPLLGGLMLLPAIPLFIILAVFGGIVHDFALQRAIEFDEGFIASIRKAASTVTGDWKQFGGYLLFRIIVSWAIAIMGFFVFITVSLVLAIPFIILGALMYALSPVVVWPVAIIGILVWTVALLYANVPFRVYLYSYFVELYDAFMEN
ncbi:MAG: hypothetical protein ABEK16_06000 [Candidatus Nanohalobium sp.]